ncbi:MAG TPA: hypothetical protein VLJ39_04515 [Tepidisphaeraceae bacterium]|nr:hypothetical protein [Tepidisphaeraceae bacterium]
MSQIPPPLPDSSQPAPINYHTPRGPEPTGSAQRVFDTVAGPNIRLKDNLIQLVSVVVGAILGGAIGWGLGAQTGLLVGLFLGLLGSLILSGVIIGIVRLFRR